MAILKHIANKSSKYSGAELYLCFEHDARTGKPLLDKDGLLIQRQGILKESINCEFNSFAAECMEVNYRFHKNRGRGDIKSHSYIISFSPKDHISVEEAMTMAKRFVNEFLEGHQAIIVVHPDGHNGSGNIHAHIVANSVRKYEAKTRRWHGKRCEYRQGGKHKCTNTMLRAGKQWVMDECRAWGLHQVDLFSSKVRDDYWVRQRGLAGDKDFISDKERLRTIIDSIINLVKDFDDFVVNLKEQYSVECRITNKTISFKLPEIKQPIRGKRLGDEYDKERIVQRIAERSVYVNAEFLDKKSMCDSYITAQAYPEVAMDVEQKAMAELQKRPQPPDWETEMRDFARKNPSMDTEELIASFYTEYNKLWDEYNASEDRKRIKKIQR